MNQNLNLASLLEHQTDTPDFQWIYYGILRLETQRKGKQYILYTVGFFFLIKRIVFSNDQQ